jgi:hypothetical protein
VDWQVGLVGLVAMVVGLASVLDEIAPDAC